MRHLKTFEEIKSSYEYFTKEELIEIDTALDRLDYILTDEGFIVKRLRGDAEEGFSYRYRVLVYRVSDHLYNYKDSLFDISKSDEFGEFVDRLSSELGSEYLVYTDLGALLFVVIEKLEKK